MYRQPSGQLKIEDFVLPFEGKLNPENRWVKLSKLIPWEEIEKNYAQLFPSNTGTEAKPLRMALGALIIKEKCGYSDRETVEQIKENPYLQFFIGLERYQDDKDPFDPSLMVHFRKRLDKDTMIAINEMICQQEEQAQDIEERIKLWCCSATPIYRATNTFPSGESFLYLGINYGGSQTIMFIIL